MSKKYSNPATAKFDQNAYDQDKSFKEKAFNIMDKAVDSFQVHQTEVSNFNSELQKEYQYEQSRQKNEATIKLWWILIDPNGTELGSFYKLWQKRPLLSTEIAGEKKSIGETFDNIITSENIKNK